MKPTSLTPVILSLLLVLRAEAQPKKNNKAGSPPNIVYILADDLGYGETGAYGQQKIETPNIDALARRGMKFTQHYAFPVCAPSRYSLMTGINSGKAFIRGNHEWPGRGDVWNFKAMEANPFLEGQFPIPDSTITIAKVLQSRGYTTGMVGKWGLGAPGSVGEPNNQGFDYFYGFICQRQDHTYYTGHLWENRLRVPLNNIVEDPNVKLPGNLDSLDEKSYAIYQQKDYTPDFLMKAALKFLDKNAAKPFFLYYPSPLPHVSLQAPKELVDYYHKKFGDEKPFLGGDYFPCRYPRATYAAMITLLDRQVGELVARLKKLGVYDNTIIMFCSDNGPAFNAGVDPVFFNSAGPFKSTYGWGKGFVREGGIRAPFIVSWPGRVKENTSSDLVSATIDIMPTLCDLLGMQAPKDIDGISILPTMLNKGKQKAHDYLYFEFPEYGGQQAIRVGDWKGVRLNMMKGNDAWSLYNLKEDPREEHDRSAQHPDVIKKMMLISQREHHTPQLDLFMIPVLEKEMARQAVPRVIP